MSKMVSSASVGTLPFKTTFPSTTNAGVVITLNFIISTMSSTFKTVAEIPFFSTTSRVIFSSVLHFEQPVPNTFISMVISLYFGFSRSVYLNFFY